MPPGFALSQLVKRVEYEHCGFRYITYVCNLTLSQKEAWSLVSEDDETDAFMWFSKSDIEVGELLDGRRIHPGVEYALKNLANAPKIRLSEK